MKYTQVELPSLHLLWKRENGEEIVSSAIRTNYPKPSLCFIPSIVKQTGLCEVEAVDMKIRDQDTIIPYREFEYGDGIMVASRMGMPFEKLETTLKKTDVLGISINPTSWSNIALDFMKYAKEVNPDIKIVIGGNEAIFRDQYYLDSGLTDIALRGEAERTLPDLIRALKENSDLRDVKGISYRENNETVRTGMAPRPEMDEAPVQALDLLEEDIPLWTTPIEYWDLPEGVSAPIGWIFMTRGCYQSCDYCTTPAKMGHKTFRYQSLERIAEELDNFKAHGITTLNVWDDSLTSVMYDNVLGREEGKQYLMDVMELFREKGFAWEFSQGVVIRDLWDTEKNKPDFEIINALYSNEMVDGKLVGCYAEYFPVEHLQTEDTSRAYEKLMTFDKEIKILDVMLDAGLKYITYASIVGTKEDTQEGFDLAIRRAKQINDLVKSKGGRSLFTPFIHSIFPGTRVMGQYKENIVFPIEEFPELYQLNTSVIRNENFEPHEITLAKRNMEREIFSPDKLESWSSTGRYCWGEKNDN